MIASRNVVYNGEIDPIGISNVFNFPLIDYAPPRVSDKVDIAFDDAENPTSVTFTIIIEGVALLFRII